jgi:serine/threonine protein kinase/Tfp pilus assembly protein PilF
MTPERWQQIEDLFHRALERESAERAAFLAQACAGDETLLREVASLLDAHEQAGSFYEAAPAELATQLLNESQAPSLVGQTLGHFKIIDLIGEGGMGKVYEAQDTRLGRKVALKLLPTEFTTDEHRLRRFEQEARAASALNHPNILTIYEIGETDGTHFIATEFIEGETLRERMTGAPMTTGDMLTVAEQVASALSAAHEAGIIHRDLKPENVMVRRDGLVKVLDFGLAKLVNQEPTDTEATTRALVKTDSGVVMGTVPYMSPEQALGRDVDHRSDLFSLGVLIYEMATGQSPFAGANSVETLDRILHAQPEAISRFNQDVPVELERIAGKCLEKDRERRYSSAQDLLLDLKNLKRGLEVGTPAIAVTSQERRRRLLLSRRSLAIAALVMLVAVALGYQLLFRRAPTAVAPEIKSLAVLPCKSLNQEAGEDYLGLGIAADIITKISQSGELTVRPTSAVRKYVNQEMDALAAARELKVDAVLDSTFLHVGDQLRVTVNLLRVADGASLWAEKFDERFTDIFAIQDKISQQVAQRLQLRLSPAQQARLTKRATSNLEAYNYYAKALYHSYNIRPDLSTRSESGLAVDLFKKAIELDPNYALAHAQLGYAYTRIAVFQEDSPALIEQAKQELGIAERLDPQLADVHTARYFILFSQYEGWQVEAAFRELRLAQELDPNAGHAELVDLYFHIGLEEQAIEEFEMALRVDPNNDRIKEAYVQLLYQSARPDEALEANKRFFNRGPDSRYYLEKRMVKEAEPLVEQEYQDPNRPWMFRNRALLLALRGKHQQAEAMIPSILEKVRSIRGYHHSTHSVARIYALGGKSEEALKWLRVTVQEGFPCYPLFLRDPFLDRIRQVPEFIKFMAEMKERWEGYQREFG